MNSRAVTTAAAIALWLAMRPVGAGAAQTLKVYGGTFAAVKRAGRSHYNMGFSVSGADPAREAAGIDLLIAATSPGDHYRLRVAKWTASLCVVQKGRAKPLAQAALVKTQLPTHRLLIKRRPHFITILWDGRQVLSVLDATHGKGVCCLRTDAGATFSDVHYQPVEPIVFADDFMRTQDEGENLGSWQVVAGDWSMQSVLDRTRANPDARVRVGRVPEARRSANPFSLSGQGAPEAIILNGFGFWDDYELRVSAKMLGGECGVVFDHRDAKNYFVARWLLDTTSLAPGRVQLVKVAAGRETVLGTRHVLGRRDNWYALRVRSVRTQIEVFIDNTRVFALSDPEATGGKIGAYARGENATLFDDFAVESVKEIRFYTAKLLEQSVHDRRGNWALGDSDGSAWASARQPADGAPSLYVVGSPGWEALLVEAKVHADKLVGRAGIVFGYRGPQDYWLAQVQPKAQGKPGQVAIVQVSAGRERVVADAPCHVPPGPYAVALDARNSGAVRFYLDDQLELRVPTPEPVAGAVGFCAAGKGEASFGELCVFGERRTDWEADVHRSIFEDDPYMQGWASRRWAWKSGVKQGDRVLYAHKGDFFGAFNCHLPVSAPFVLRFGEDAFGRAESGYAFDVAFDAKTRASRLALRRSGKEVWSAAKVALPALPPPGPAETDDEDAARVVREHVPAFGPVIVCREGRYVWAAAAGREVMSYRDPAPPRGRGVAMVTDQGFDLSQVTMRRDHVLDYIFETAPRDWLKIGEWAVTNRFACDPRWSHLNGRSRGVATLWNKYGLVGDFTLECYAGMRMRQGDLKKGGAAPYPRVGDINICVCGDGQDVFTGYNFILASWDKLWSERWSKLYRLDQVVAKTDREFIPRTRDHSADARVIEVEWDPGGRAIHGAWYFLKLRRQGNKLSLTFDDVPVISYTDPKPLPNKHVALWTQDNSIVVARMKLSYERRERHAARLVPAPKVAASPPKDIEDDAIRVTSLTHPSLVYDFETGLQGWHEAHLDQGAVLTRERRPGKGHCLKLVNAYDGGDAGAEIPVQSAELSRVELLEFDYRVQTGAKVNLYMALEGEPERYYFVHLTGLRETSENMRMVAALPEARPDGQWRHARIGLAGAFKRLEPARNSFVLKRMAIGNLHEGYLNAGLGGNKAGATYWIDNFSMVGWGPSGAVVEWFPTGDHVFTHYAYCVDRSPQTSPPDTPLTSETLTVLSKLGPGVSYFHIKGRGSDGQWSIASHYPLNVSAPLAVEGIVPPPGSPWAGGPIQVRFHTNAQASLVPAKTALRINGNTVAFSEYAFRYDAQKQELLLRLNQCGLSFANGAKLDFSLHYRSTLSITPGAQGHDVEARAAACRWHYVMDFGRDKEPPSRVRTDKCLVDHDFETSMPWQTYGGARGATLVRDTSTAASGEASVKLINHLVAGSFGALILNKAFSAGSYPLVSFDYRTDGSARADLQLTGGISSAVEFTDNDTTITRIGRVPNLRTDGQWHHAALDLRRMFDTAAGNYTPRLYDVRRLLFADGGHCANPPGVFYNIDNFRIGAVLCGTKSVSMTLQAQDISGIAGYSYMWSAKPDGAPDKTVDSANGQVSFAKLDEARPYLHVSCQDKAGNWGPVSHFQFLVDSTHPTVKCQAPAPGSLSAEPNIALEVTDGQSGVDPATFKLSMNGQARSLSASHTRYDPVSGSFMWDWVQAQPAMTEPIPDKTAMRVTMDGVQDFAGNSAEAVTWGWKIDYAKDKASPGKPDLQCISRAPLVYDTFSSSVGQWLISATYGTLERYFDPERKDWCLKVVKANRGWFWIYARRGHFSTSEHPLVCFDYKFPPGLKIQFVIYYNGTWHSIKLTATGTYPHIGEVPGIVADGAWRHVMFNLHDILVKAEGASTEFRPYYLALVGALPNQNPAGTTYFLDNFCIFGEGLPAPQFQWFARDVTGISGVSYVLDRQPDTVPAATVGGKARDVYSAVADAPGLWYFHARARDGAGNWGAAERHPYYCADPASAAGPDALEADALWAGHGSEIGTSLDVRTLTTANGQNKVLRLEYASSKLNAVAIRLPRSMDLSKKRKLAMDLYHSHDKEINVSVQLHTGPSREPYTSRPQSIAQRGWTRNLAFDLRAKEFRSNATRYQYTSDVRNPAQVAAVVLTFAPKHKSGVLLIDKLRLD